MSKPNKERLVLQAVWRKAFTEGSVTLRLPTVQALRRTRFALYNAVRDAREGKADAELNQATAECLVSADEVALTLTVQHSGKSELVLDIAAQIGVEVEGLQEQDVERKTSQEELAMAESQRLLLEKLNAPAAPRTTPYYTRER